MKKLLQIVILGFSIIVYCQKQTAPQNKIISNADTNLNNTEALKGIAANTISEVATVTSSEVGITEGQLSVSLSGAATYNIPIAVPPGLAGVLPQISLNYNSQGGNGNAGYGWGIAGVSVISRIPSSMYHDGVIDAVDFDTFDRFALDGQRLIIKSGTAGVYGGQGTVYETENYSKY